MAIYERKPEEPTDAYSAIAGCGCRVEWTNSPFPQNLSVTHECAQIAKLNRVVEAARTIQREIYPKDIFVGCDNCHTGNCDCNRGVQITRILHDALAALDEGEGEAGQSGKVE